MIFNIPDNAYSDIVSAAKKYNVQKIILFGSRARKTNRKGSDIDLAVSGGDVLNFSFDIEDEARTLLSFDVINLDANISNEIKKEIERDGIIIYEKV